jgi:hypothetical protein
LFSGYFSYHGWVYIAFLSDLLLEFGYIMG